MSVTTHGAYTVHPSPPPSVASYLHLRTATGLSPKTAEQAKPALQNSWFFVHVRHTETDEIVGMGRILGDGGWYFHIADMAVLSEHQRKGLGSVILRRLVDEVRARAPAGGKGALINLEAGKQGRRLYEKEGFEFGREDTSLGMMRWLD